MKIGLIIARSLLGLMFVVFGLNGFLHFIPQPPLPAGFAGQFFSVSARDEGVAREAVGLGLARVVCG